MKTVLNVVGAVLISLGLLWALQGLNLVGGSFMTGQREWIVMGAIAMIAGAGIFWGNTRRR